MTREEMIVELQDHGGIEIDKEFVEMINKELLEIMDCKEYMRFVFFDDEVRYLPDGYESHPIRFDKWEDLNFEDIEKYYKLFKEVN